ncbi:MAG: hypothetical protein JWP89_3600 [Schlesneria sp.]|nr:hypothetical protein [Schlesneria sp.]
MNDVNDHHNRRKIAALILAGCAVPLAFVLVFLGFCYGFVFGFGLYMLSVVIAMCLIAFAVWVVVRCGTPRSESDDD